MELDWWTGSSALSGRQSLSNRRPTMWSRVVSALILWDILWYSATKKVAKSQKVGHIWNLRIQILCVSSLSVSWPPGCSLPKMQKRTTFDNVKEQIFTKEDFESSFLTNSQHQFKLQLSLLPTLTTKKAKLRFPVNTEFYMRFFFAFQGLHLQIIVLPLFLAT